MPCMMIMHVLCTNGNLPSIYDERILYNYYNYPVDETFYAKEYLQVLRLKVNYNDFFLKEEAISLATTHQQFILWDGNNKKLAPIRTNNILFKNRNIQQNNTGFWNYGSILSLAHA